MDKVSLEKPAFALTAKELISLLKEELQPHHELKVQERPAKAEYLYSLRELAKFLGCSVVTAQKIKNSGKIRYTQIGRKLMFNTSEVLEDLKGSVKLKIK